jgi:hypothetical protein
MALPNYVKATQYFRQLQRDEYNYEDNCNIVQAKWDMRAVMEDIDDDKMLKKLIQFFLKLSDDKSFKEFFQRYDQYYETMLETISDRRRRRAIREETLKRGTVGDQL